MSDGLSCTFYSYLPASAVCMPNWADDENRKHFYERIYAARQAVGQLKCDVAQDPEYSWKPIHLVKIELSAISTDAVLVLLSEGISSLVKNYEILETIDDKN